MALKFNPFTGTFEHIEQGPQGEAGPAGPEGDPGPQGIQGPTGEDGVDGTDGADGADGPSAYEVAVGNGFVGTEAQWLASLVGPQGAQGATGATGAQGPTGPAGPAGAASLSPRSAYTAGQYTTCAITNASQTSATFVINRLYLVPFFCRFNMTFDRMRISLGATSNVRLGVYSADGAAGRPKTLLLNAGVITGVGAGDKELTGLSQALAASTWYWLAFLGETATTTPAIGNGAQPIWDTNSPNVGSVNTAFYMTHNYSLGTLPADVESSLISHNIMPNIQLRVA